MFPTSAHRKQNSNRYSAEEHLQKICTLSNADHYKLSDDTICSAPSSSSINVFLHSTGISQPQFSERPITSFESVSLIKRRTFPSAMKFNLGKKVRNIPHDRSLIVDTLAIFFGIGTWIGINGTFIQLPLLVEVAPEGWSLPSYLSVMVQIGNLGPLVYTLMQKFSVTKDAPIIYILLASGTLSALLTAFFYSDTAYILGSERSLALFALTVFTAITACTSSVLFMPYMGRFKEIYLVTYFVGEGLSGFLPSVVALIQGIGGAPTCVLQNFTESGGNVYEKYIPPPRFGSQEYFLFVFAMMLLSCIGFTLLDRLRICKSQYAAVTVNNGNDYVYERRMEQVDQTEFNHNGLYNDLAPQISNKTYVFLLFLIGIISCFANGIFNSIQSYSCRPYGGQAYHLSTTLSSIANPSACFLAIFLPRTSLCSILTLTGLAGILTVYVFVTAIMSPHPPLYDTTSGAVLVILAWTILIGLVSYIKLSITTVMRSQGGKSLVWTGGFTQFGSLIGSILIFVLINVTKNFTDAESKC